MAAQDSGTSSVGEVVAEVTAPEAPLLCSNTTHALVGLPTAAGSNVLACAALGVSVLFGSASMATGGEPLPLGRPVLHSAG